MATQLVIDRICCGLERSPIWPRNCQIRTLDRQIRSRDNRVRGLDIFPLFFVIIWLKPERGICAVPASSFYYCFQVIKVSSNITTEPVAHKLVTNMRFYCPRGSQYVDWLSFIVVGYYQPTDCLRGYRCNCMIFQNTDGILTDFLNCLPEYTLSSNLAAIAV